MERDAAGASFLVRLSPTPAAGGAVGVATHIQSGERLAFASFTELERFLRAHAGLEATRDDWAAETGGSSSCTRTEGQR